MNLASLKMSNITPLEHQELNLNPDYWIKRFLYPFALDKAPLKLSDYPMHGDPQPGASKAPPTRQQKQNGKVDILSTDQYNFPESRIDHKKEYLLDIINPLTI